MDFDVGKCSGNFTRFYYDIDMKKCRPFDYGGCRGNKNRFDTLEECEKSCTAAMLSQGQLLLPYFIAFLLCMLYLLQGVYVYLLPIF